MLRLFLHFRINLTISFRIAYNKLYKNELKSRKFIESQEVRVQVLPEDWVSYFIYQ